MKSNIKKKIRDILQYSFQYIPYYRNAFLKSGIIPKKMKLPDDFMRVPILTKSHILQHYGDGLQPFGNRFKNINKSLYYFRGSSGTTLNSVRTFRELDVVDIRRRTASRINKLWGQHRGKSFCYFSNPINSGLYLESNYKTSSNRFIRMQKNIPSSLQLTSLPDEKIEEIIDDINAYKPVYVQGDPYYLAYISDYILSKGYKVNPVKFVITGIEPLLKNHRNLIGEAFKCRVYNHWNSSEADTLGIECASEQKLHLTENYINFEFVEIPECLPAKKLYKVLITTLDTKVMPLIRYDIGDVVSLYSSDRTCKCKKSGKIIKSVEGKVSDLIKLRDNGYITISDLDRIFSQSKKILYYRLILGPSDTIEVKIFLRRNYHSVNVTGIKEKLSDLFNGSKNIHLKIVSSFLPEKNGKFSIVKFRQKSIQPDI